MCAFFASLTGSMNEIDTKYLQVQTSFLLPLTILCLLVCTALPLLGELSLHSCHQSFLARLFHSEMPQNLLSRLYFNKLVAIGTIIIS